MSGICGIVHADGTPVDLQLVRRMTEFMAFRGPDAQDVWVEGAVGFGHTLLRTTFESRNEHQPLTLGGETWITADARIDGQADLRKKLETQGRTGLETANDSELILHAYHAWGEECTAHLIGDFAFAIWDGPRQQLFCARDHFGVKPFFYALVSNGLVFSNTLNCVRQHPGVADTLNDVSIADHLLFEFIQDPTATAFAEINRLAPANSLMWSPAGIRLKTYWTLPCHAEVRYRLAGDYVERFKELLAVAVADRLRTDHVAVEMSGGLDSTSVTAVALDQLNAQSRPFELNAYAMVFDHLIPDQERHFSGLAAQKLGIPIHYSVGDCFKLLDDAHPAEWLGPEPAHCPVPEMVTCTMAAAQNTNRVVLTGWDGDSLLDELPGPYFRTLLKQGKFMSALAGVVAYVFSQRSRLLPRAREWLDRRRGRHATHRPMYPVWLDPGLEQRLNLRSRWRHYNQPADATHPLRPKAHKALAPLGMSSFFDFCDAGVTHRPMEFRHPLFDLRLVDYCLSLPPYPWCYKKEILRSAMLGVLPEAVRLRPKTPLAGYPHAVLLEGPEARSIDDFVAAPALRRYVAREKVPSICAGGHPDATWMDMRPFSLNNWLKSLHPVVVR